MFETLSSGWLLAASAFGALGALIVAAVLALPQVRARFFKAADDSAQQHALRELAELRKQVQSVQNDIKQLKRNQRAATPYGQAILMAQQGLDAREVAAVCGLSRGEAELIVALYKTHYS